MNKTISHFDINKLILNNIDLFLRYFQLELDSTSCKYFGPCPIHPNSDNPNALLLYKNSGIWMCNTHHCENIFNKSSLGFIRGLLSSKKRGWQDRADSSKMASVKETEDFSLKILNKSILPLIKTPNSVILIDRDKQDFIRQSRLLKKSHILFDINTFKQYCDIPSPYYINKGFSKEVLIKYHVGIMKKENHEFYGQTIVPILDHDENYVLGLTARNNNPLCLMCSYHHPIGTICLDKSSEFKMPKWNHNRGFNKQNHLFNYWIAKTCINNNHTLIITEGPTDCIRLEEAGICNSVAILGSSISQQQCTFIKRCNINKIIIATDNDEGGEIASESIIKNLGKDYEYSKLELPSNDIGDMSVQEIQELFNV